MIDGASVDIYVPNLNKSHLKLNQLLIRLVLTVRVLSPSSNTDSVTGESSGQVILIGQADRADFVYKPTRKL